MLDNINEDVNLARMQKGQLYYAFSPKLVAARSRCAQVIKRLNNAGDLTRREIAVHWQDITQDPRPLPPPGSSDTEEDALLHAYPWVERPITVDYGTNVHVGSNVFINFNCTFLDTCAISIGSRTLVGPNVSFFTASHPVDPDLRDGTNGPEYGAPITIGDDCWISGNVQILPGVTVGDGATIGAGSVVTKDVPANTVVAGNPARVIRTIERGAAKKAHLEEIKDTGLIVTDGTAEGESATR